MGRDESLSLAEQQFLISIATLKKKGLNQQSERLQESMHVVCREIRNEEQRFGFLMDAIREVASKKELEDIWRRYVLKAESVGVEK